MSQRCLGCMEMFGDEFTVCPYCGYIVGTEAEEAVHMDPGSLLYDRYIVGKVLGYGGFGVTYVGWDGKLEQKVAIKEYLPSEFSTRMPGQSQVTIFNGDKGSQFRDGMKKFVEEAKNLAKFQNESGIVKIFDSFEENDTAYIIMEYLDGETLSDYLRREKNMSEDDVVEMLTPVMESLQVVHEAGLIHRDIAPDNIFITKDGEVKLIDFGASRYATTSHSRSLTVIVKPGFSPEEQYRSRGDQGPHTDVYALASTMYKMITGKTPPDAMERRAKYENQSKDILEEPHKINKNISANRENAILNAMNVRIEDRTPDIATFIKELNADPPAKRIYGKIKKIDIYSWPLWLKILIPSTMLLILAFGILLLTGVINFSRFSEEIVIPDNIVIVPDVEGMYEDEALEKIQSGNLIVQTDGTIESEFIPAGKIILQNPVGGSYMTKNGTVGLTVSSGKGVVSPENGISTVPYVIWDEKSVAIEKLEKAGLVVGEIKEEYDENVSYGSVISQTLKSGSQVEEGTVVGITVSLGPKAFAMPDVRNLDKSEAEEILNSKGLVVNFEYRKTDEVNENSVLEQSVAPNETVKRGDTITIIVSSGRETIDVANIVGMTKNDAKKTLEEQGFKVAIVENYDSNVMVGSVISQNPVANSHQLPDATIVISVSKGKKPITLTFNANGGSVSPLTKDTYLSSTYDDLPVPTRTGYSFIGWYSSAEGGMKVADTTVITTPSNHTLYAHWSANSYIVSFNTNGGDSSPSNKTVTFDTKYGSLSTASRNGYTFAGWYTAANGGNKVASDTVLKTAQNHTLYAHWTANTYTLTFNANGGSVSTSSKSVDCGSSYGVLPEASRTGYTFNGWYTATNGGSKVNTATTMSAGNVTVYAQWSINSYSVSWSSISNCTISVRRTSSPNAGMSTGLLSSGSAIYYGDTLSVTYTASTGYSIVSKGATSITVTGNVTSSDIYASVTANSYTYNIVYKSSNGTSLGSSTATYKYGTTNTITAPVKSGYNTPGSQSIKWDSTSAKTITFTYTPEVVATSQNISSGTWWYYNGASRITYSVNVEYRNRTANSIQIRFVWTNTLVKYHYYGYHQYFYASSSGVNTGDIMIVSSSTWSSSVNYDRAETAYSGWITVPVSATQQTLSVGADYWDSEHGKRYINADIAIPVY